MSKWKKRREVVRMQEVVWRRDSRRVSGLCCSGGEQAE
jgi:hypothetical protein